MSHVSAAKPVSGGLYPLASLIANRFEVHNFLPHDCDGGLSLSGDMKSIVAGLHLEISRMYSAKPVLRGLPVIEQNSLRTRESTEFRIN